MRKIIFTVFMLVFCHVHSSYADTLEFTSGNNNESNEVLKNYITSNFSGFRGNVESHYYDINNDGVDEVLGIVKSKLFYNPEGYRLIVLKKEGLNWIPVSTDVYFNPDMEFNIEGNKITYYKSLLNKAESKKCTGKISDKTEKNFKDVILSDSSKGNDKVYYVSEGISGVEIDIASVTVPVQRSVMIQYKGTPERTKRYMEIR